MKLFIDLVYVRQWVCFVIISSVFLQLEILFLGYPPIEMIQGLWYFAQLPVVLFNFFFNSG